MQPLREKTCGSGHVYPLALVSGSSGVRGQGGLGSICWWGRSEVHSGRRHTWLHRCIHTDTCEYVHSDDCHCASEYVITVPGQCGHPAVQRATWGDNGCADDVLHDNIVSVCFMHKQVKICGTLILKAKMQVLTKFELVVVDSKTRVCIKFVFVQLYKYTYKLYSCPIIHRLGNKLQLDGEWRRWCGLWWPSFHVPDPLKGKLSGFPSIY